MMCRPGNIHIWCMKVCLAHKFECILLNFGALQCFNMWMHGLKLLLVLSKEPIEVYRVGEN